MTREDIGKEVVVLIKILRIDKRLLHGQVAFTWTTSVGADCILIACDSLQEDPLRLTTIKMSKPAGIKLVVKNIGDSIEAINSGKTDPYKLMVIVESITDAYRMIKGCAVFKGVSIGYNGKRENTETLTSWVWATPEEIGLIKELLADGIHVEMQNVPTTKAISASKLIK